MHYNKENQPHKIKYRLHTRETFHQLREENIENTFEQVHGHLGEDLRSFGSSMV